MPTLRIFTGVPLLCMAKPCCRFRSFFSFKLFFCRKTLQQFMTRILRFQCFSFYRTYIMGLNTPTCHSAVSDYLSCLSMAKATSACRSRMEMSMNVSSLMSRVKCDPKVNSNSTADGWFSLEATCNAVCYKQDMTRKLACLGDSKIQTETHRRVPRKAILRL